MHARGYLYTWDPSTCQPVARLAHTPAHPELAWMDQVRAHLTAVLRGYKSKAPHTASVRDAVGLGLEHHFSQCSTIHASPGQVARVGGSDKRLRCPLTYHCPALSECTCTVWHVCGWEVTLFGRVMMGC